MVKHEYPVIGIRPIVDGRQGPMMLRESLEGQDYRACATYGPLFKNVK